MIFNCYHGTDNQNAENIIKNGFDVSKCSIRDDHWLGKGIYFFSEKEYAVWWASFKNNGVILNCIVSCSDKKYLNLDSLEDICKFTKKCECYAKKYPAKYKNDKQLRSVMLDLYKKDNDIDVVSMTFDFISGTFTKPYHFNTSNMDLMKKMNIKFKQRQICVSNSNIINNIEKCEKYVK